MNDGHTVEEPWKNGWYAVSKTTDLTPEKPLAIRVLAQDLVLWSTRNGITCVSDRCPHRGTRLSLGWIADERLVCPYHGWEYAEDGTCRKIPAQRRVPPSAARVTRFPVIERDGLIMACLTQEPPALPSWPGDGEDGFRSIVCGPYWFRSSAPRVVENFLDVAHFSFVHAGLLGDPALPEIEDYPVRLSAEGPVASPIRVFQPNTDGSGQGSTVEYSYRVKGAYGAEFAKESLTGTFAIALMATPVNPTDTQAWMIIRLNYDIAGLTDEDFRHFQDVLAEQDRQIVESQDQALLPLDLRRELHVRADALAVQYRKWLTEQGVTFGTSLHKS